ncbi:DASH family cryptochrome [Acidovorax sp. LjRoot66]|uniref:DASH family cryptochrome n=1 Tax=Acidovorax sp. LjRoot66 TaxID=3342334 RepID=UPI003ECE3DEF
MTAPHTVLFWFRSDLRLHDQGALAAALGSGATHLVPVHCQPPADEAAPWGFARRGLHRRAFEGAALRDLAAGMARLGNPLLQCQGQPAAVLPALASAVGATTVVCEEIAAPHEQAEVAALRTAGLQVQTVWHSSLLQPCDLPWPVGDLPGVFTTFRQAVEQAGIQPPQPLPAPAALLPPPAALTDAVWQEVLHMAGAVGAAQGQGGPGGGVKVGEGAGCDVRSSFPYGTPACDGGETAALAHVQQYLVSGHPHTYKATRNGLTGLDYSSKFSPWLATGALSARHAMAALRRFESTHGANEGTYWLWFELLWRDYFRLLHLQHGRTLYRARGLSAQPLAPHNAAGFARWCAGDTGEPLVDAALRELAATGYLSNRLRQVAASYLIHDLQGDWRAGAAWFESQLVDYDPYSNQGNWLYIAGRGTDPRGGRRFNPAKQTQEHDADGSYRRLWGTA